MPKFDMGSVIIIQIIIILFLFTIIGMLTRCRTQIDKFVSESTIEVNDVFIHESIEWKGDAENG